jgi:anti-sigma factor ChrR (cupin superfamily)
MSATPESGCRRTPEVQAYALQILAHEDRVGLEAHLNDCPACREELAALGPVIDRFASWPVDVLRPTRPLWGRIASMIGVAGTGGRPESWAEPEWEQVAPGISCRILASDTARNRVSMLVRLEPGVEYPPHRHAGLEELHLLEGELWIDDRLLHAGDYNRSLPGTSDHRVWSQTGCTCVLITSPGDVLR